MQLETERLYLVLLSANQLALWVNDLAALEKELNCSYQAEPMQGVFLEIVKGQIDKAFADEANYLYHSFWFLMRKPDRVVVGTAALKDVPSTSGEVEIGYGLGKKFEHNGYMTEAVKAMCDWALEQNDIAHVIAETEVGNTASQNILKRCGFSCYRQADTYWWRL